MEVFRLFVIWEAPKLTPISSMQTEKKQISPSPKAVFNSQIRYYKDHRSHSVFTSLVEGSIFFYLIE